MPYVLSLSGVLFLSHILIEKQQYKGLKKSLGLSIAPSLLIYKCKALKLKGWIWAKFL
jgi:hypothetical protein